MAVLKCKMCGGNLEIIGDTSVSECDHCGRKQTVPKVEDEKAVALFTRANRLRFNCEFDKAAGVYETIVTDFPEEAEAYWGLVLCKYGIEYVDDPATGNKIPTCHRSSFESVFDDNNFELVMEYADVVARGVYREEAKDIEALRKGIIEVSSKEEPYDIFICYKESDNGDRTVDSLIAQDVYDALTEKGYRVFFSRITLEDKLGQEYEPYIFAALNSAKIMLAFGTDYEYYNSVWVKNEWSRFLQLIAKGEKKTIIPCFKGIDANDMPKEFAKLQSQDMGKVGALQDLIRGVEKILPKGTANNETAVQQSVNNPTLNSLLERVFMFLEDGEFRSAGEYCEKVLDIEPKNATAYVGKLMVALKVKTKAEIYKCSTPLQENAQFAKALRFADASLAEELNGYIAQNAEYIAGLEEKARQEEIARKEALEAAKEALKKPRVLAQRLQNLLCCSLNGNTVLDQNGKLHSASSKAQKCIDGLADKFFVGLYGDKYGITADGCVYDIDYPYEFDLKAKQSNITYFNADGYGPALAVANKQIVIINTYKLTDEICDEITEWQGVVKAAYGSVGENSFVAALCEDGKVLVSGSAKHSSIVQNWNDVIDIAVYDDDIIALRKDGTVVGAGDNKYDELNGIDTWSEIALIYTDKLATIGVKHNGTVVAAGCNEDGELNLSNWTDIISICKRYGTTYGLKKDGTVLIAGDTNYGTNLIKNWRNVVSLYTADYQMAGILADGSVVIAPKDSEDANRSLLDVSNFRLFESLDTFVFPADSEKAKQIANFTATNEDKTDICQKRAEQQKYKGILACTHGHTLGLMPNGTVIAAGEKGKYKFGECKVSGWKNIKRIYTHSNMSVGIKHDGSVVYTGSNFYTKSISKWKNVEKMSFGDNLAAALTKNGSAYAEGMSYDYGAVVSTWSDLVDVVCSKDDVFGLKKDGTVLVARNMYATSGAAKWTDITAIACGANHIVGLKKDGTVVAVGDNKEGQCNVSKWKNVIAIFTTTEYKSDIYSTKTLALTKSGKLYSTDEFVKSARNDIIDIVVHQSEAAAILANGTVKWLRGGRYSSHNHAEWHDIVDVCIGFMCALGLRSDGTVVVACNPERIDYGHCDVLKWKLSTETASNSETVTYDTSVSVSDEWKAQGLCRYCGGSFKGMFGKKCSVCSRPKDY